MLFYILKLTCFNLCFLRPIVLCLFDQCNHEINMKVGEKLYVNSPYYPASYPVGSSCRYAFKAPQNYKLKFTCDVKIKTPHAATSCLNDVLYFNREGSELLTASEYFCGTGKMERKSFLNQAVIWYISTPSFNRMFASDVKEVEGGMSVNEIIGKTKTQQQTIKTTTVKPTPSFKPLKVDQLTTTTTATRTIRKTSSTSLPTFFTPPTSSTTSFFPSSSVIKKDKNVNNLFAYVVALLSNKTEIKAFQTKSKRTTTKTILRTQPFTTKRTVTKSPAALRPIRLLSFYGILPVNTWFNGSIAKHKISSKRVSKVIVGQDFTSSHLQLSFPTPLPSFSQFGAYTNEKGGSFSCLVEVIEPQCECGWSSTIKIAGASGVAGINEFPSMAGVMTIKNQRIFCGATIIHHLYLLSAAHCYVASETSKPEYLRAVVGEHDLSTALESVYTRYHDIAKILTHEYFHVSLNKVNNDIALLKTRHPIQWNPSVGPVCLPFYTLVEGAGTVPIGGQKVDVAGWGTTSFGGQQSSILLKATLNVVDQMQCQNIMENIPSDTFCTYTPGRDTCQYDSGGALYVHRERLYAVGIVSYGFACATNQPSVNTRISSHLQWIRKKTPEAKYCTK